MYVGKRLKTLRDKLDITQNDFAKKIALSRGYLASIETDAQEINDRIIKLICQEFNVNEYWLKTGQGEMFLNIEADSFSELQKQYSLDEMDKQIVLQYLKLNQYERKVIKDYIVKIVNGCERNEDI